MKKSIVLPLIIIVLTNLLYSGQLYGQKKVEGRISISGAFALYAMSVKWAEEFRKINPKVHIDISAGGAGKGITDVLNELIDIGMVSRDLYAEELKKGAVPIAVTKDAVIGVVNSSNPILKELKLKGITREGISAIWLTGTIKNWKQLIQTNLNATIHLYTRSDACGAAEVWAHFAGGQQEDLLGSAVFGDPGLALAIRKDPLGIGFNNLCYAYDFVTRMPFKGIQPVPIDLNKNGKIDPDEDFYESLDQIIQAVSEGRYPSPPGRELFFVINAKLKNKAAIEFLRWVLTDGQKYVKESGCINLTPERLNKELQKIN